MAECFRIKTPAKINLFLKIESRRSDGFHNLSSLFQTIAIYDELSFKVSDNDLLNSSDCLIPVDGSNLIWRAVNALRDKLDFAEQFHIELQKNIPHQAGLGGGSSDAAATLYAINKLLKEPLTLHELRLIAADIGSDVPFFLSSGTAFCTGRGEMIEELPTLPLNNYILWIVKPDFGLSTPAVYKNLKLSNLETMQASKCLSRIYNNDPYFFNDLESSAFELKEELKIIKEALISQGFKHVLMSGSGTSIFCLTDNASLTPEYASTQIFKTSFSKGIIY